MSGSDRSKIAERLYLEGGAQDAARRCDLNTQFGQFDLGAELVRRARLSSGQSIADIGCGSGRHLEVYAQIVGASGRSLGFDFSEAAVRAARNKGLDAAIARGDAIPLPDASLDALTCNYAIYYMPDLKTALREWARVLKPDGRIVITGPAADSNAELYRFHLQASGMGPSDADRVALGYVDTIVVPALLLACLQPDNVTVVSNPVVLPGSQFLAYWRATSLFLRTVPQDRADGVLARGEELLRSYSGGFTVTKRITIVTARKIGV